MRRRRLPLSHGKDSNPRAVAAGFLSPGEGGDCGGALEGTCLSAYKLAAGSRMKGAGSTVSSYSYLAPPATGDHGASFRNAQGYKTGPDTAGVSTAAQVAVAAGSPCDPTRKGSTIWIYGTAGSSDIATIECRHGATRTNQNEQLCTNGVRSDASETQWVDVVKEKADCKTPKTQLLAPHNQPAQTRSARDDGCPLPVACR